MTYVEAKQRESARERSYQTYVATCLQAISNRAQIVKSLYEFRHPEQKKEEVADAKAYGIDLLTRMGCKQKKKGGG